MMENENFLATFCSGLLSDGTGTLPVFIKEKKSNYIEFVKAVIHLTTVVFPHVVERSELRRLAKNYISSDYSSLELYIESMKVVPKRISLKDPESIDNFLECVAWFVVQEAMQS